MPDPVTIGSKTLSKNSSVFIIAEIGVNHGGDMELAKKMILAAKEIGADAVKFQTFTAESLVSPGTPKVFYQESTTDASESHYEMIQKLEFRREDHAPIKEFCEKNGLQFLSTPYDVDSAKFLNELGVAAFKTASADLVDLPLQQYLASTGKPVIVSTGMADEAEIRDVAQIYKDQRNPNLILLHCVSNYPCADESLNLKAMNGLQRQFPYWWGFSDHSVGALASCLSVALGGRVIEKHFTLDKSLPGPDHKASSTPEEFKALVERVRRTERMLGSEEKRCQEEERQMARVSRKSWVLNRDLPKGTILKKDMLVLKRPGTGLQAIDLDKILNKKTKTSLLKNSQLQWNDLE